MIKLIEYNSCVRGGVDVWVNTDRIVKITYSRMLGLYNVHLTDLTTISVKEFPEVLNEKKT